MGRLIEMRSELYAKSSGGRRCRRLILRQLLHRQIQILHLRQNRALQHRLIGNESILRCDDPVLFLEHKRLYRETFGRAVNPGPDYMIPFGKAKVVHSGTDVTVITYGAVVPRALQATQRLDREHGIKVELIDLRSLNPYDWDAIATSVQKTSRAIVAYEDTLSWGYGAEIAARIADELFEHLDAPVKRVAANCSSQQPGSIERIRRENDPHSRRVGKDTLATLRVIDGAAR